MTSSVISRAMRRSSTSRACAFEQGRGADFVARVGGEEFAVVLPGTDSAGALLAAERLRQAVRSQLTRPDGEPLSASFGVAACPGDAVDAEWLLAGADRAMYAAKAGGRDRCVAYADLPEAPVTGSRAGWAALPPAA
jgi:diguanylate cyclase (GGDEF)-like protein